jgi:hypothetical protein
MIGRTIAGTLSEQVLFSCATTKNACVPAVGAIVFYPSAHVTIGVRVLHATSASPFVAMPREPMSLWFLTGLGLLYRWPTRTRRDISARSRAGSVVSREA